MVEETGDPLSACGAITQNYVRRLDFVVQNIPLFFYDHVMYIVIYLHEEVFFTVGRQ